MGNCKKNILQTLFCACTLLGTVCNAEDLRIPALGRRARFFELYNLEHDEFTRIVAIPRANERKYRVKVVPIYNREYSYRAITSMTEYIDSMNYGVSVKAGVALSCFKGSVETSFNKKNQFKSSTMSITIVMSVKVKTIREEVDPCRQDIWKVQSKSIADKEVQSSGRIMGDHVLVAKEYGFEVNIFIKLSSKSSEESSSLETSLKSSAEAMMVSVSASMSTNNTNLNRTVDEDVTITVDTRYASFPYGVPTDYKKVAQFVKNVTAYLNDNANLNGSVIDYIMKPSHEIEKCRKLGQEQPKTYTNFDRISERMFTFLLELDRQETENDRFRSRFDVAKDCLNSTEYTHVVRQILDTRMNLMDMRIKLIESIDNHRKGNLRFAAIMDLISKLIVKTVKKEYCIKKNIPVALRHKINFIFALWNDRGILCLSRNLNPTLQYDSYVADTISLAFIIFRSADFTSGVLGLEKYIDWFKKIDIHQKPPTESEREGTQQGKETKDLACVGTTYSEMHCDYTKKKGDGYVALDELTGKMKILAYMYKLQTKKFIALNCDVDYDVCEILPNAGLYDGWEYYPLGDHKTMMFAKMETVHREYDAERELQTFELLDRLYRKKPKNSF